MQIDDVYCKTMGEYLKKEAQELDNFINDYICILKEIKCKAIITGKVANALDMYIACASRMQNQFGIRAYQTKNQIAKFLAKIDEADEYLY